MEDGTKAKQDSSINPPFFLEEGGEENKEESKDEEIELNPIKNLGNRPIRVIDVVNLFNARAKTLAALAQDIAVEEQQQDEILAALDNLLIKILEAFANSKQPGKVNDLASIGMINKYALFKKMIGALLDEKVISEWGNFNSVLNSLAFAIHQGAKLEHLAQIENDQVTPILNVINTRLEDLQGNSPYSQIEALDAITNLLETLLAVATSADKDLCKDIARNLNQIAKDNKNHNEILWFKACYTAQAALHLGNVKVRNQFISRRSLHVIKGVCYLGVAGAGLGLAVGTGYIPAAFTAGVNIINAVENFKAAAPGETFEQAEWFPELALLQSHIDALVTYSKEKQKLPSQTDVYEEQIQQFQQEIAKHRYCAMFALNSVLSLIANVEYIHANPSYDLDVKACFDLLEGCLLVEYKDETNANMVMGILLVLYQLKHLTTIPERYQQQIRIHTDKLFAKAEIGKLLQDFQFVDENPEKETNRIKDFVDVILDLWQSSTDAAARANYQKIIGKYLTGKQRYNGGAAEIKNSPAIQVYLYHKLQEIQTESIKSFLKSFEDEHHELCHKLQQKITRIESKKAKEHNQKLAKRIHPSAIATGELLPRKHHDAAIEYLTNPSHLVIQGMAELGAAFPAQHKLLRKGHQLFAQIADKSIVLENEKGGNQMERQQPEANQAQPTMNPGINAPPAREPTAPVAQSPAVSDSAQNIKQRKDKKKKRRVGTKAKGAKYRGSPDDNAEEILYGAKNSTFTFGDKDFQIAIMREEARIEAMRQAGEEQFSEESSEEEFSEKESESMQQKLASMPQVPRQSPSPQASLQPQYSSGPQTSPQPQQTPLPQTSPQPQQTPLPQASPQPQQIPPIPELYPSPTSASPAALAIANPGNNREKKLPKGKPPAQNQQQQQFLSLEEMRKQLTEEQPGKQYKQTPTPKPM